VVIIYSTNLIDKFNFFILSSFLFYFPPPSDAERNMSAEKANQSRPKHNCYGRRQQQQQSKKFEQKRGKPNPFLTLVATKNKIRYLP
jgi:hypothetical protein